MKVSQLAMIIDVLHKALSSSILSSAAYRSSRLQAMRENADLSDTIIDLLLSDHSSLFLFIDY